MLKKIGFVAILCLLAWAILLAITYHDPERIGIESLIKELGADDIAVADWAQSSLIDIGPQAVDILKKHDNPQEAKINARIKAILDAINEAEMERIRHEWRGYGYTETSPISTMLILLIPAGIIVLISILVTMKKKFGKFW